jgi:hypothetical protein
MMFKTIAQQVEVGLPQNGLGPELPPLPCPGVGVETDHVWALIAHHTHEIRQSVKDKFSSPLRELSSHTLLVCK